MNPRFALPDQLGEAFSVRAARWRLTVALEAIAPFEVELVRTAWFCDAVLWLAPRSDASLRAVIEAVEGVFPSLRPYGGAYDETIPHLTIGDGKPRSVLVEAEATVARLLPITDHADAVTLLAERSDGKWHPIDVFPLGG